MLTTDELIKKEKDKASKYVKERMETSGDKKVNEDYKKYEEQYKDYIKLTYSEV